MIPLSGYTEAQRLGMSELEYRMLSPKTVQFITQLNPESYPHLPQIKRYELMRQLTLHLATVSGEEAQALRRARERAIDASVAKFYEDHPLPKVNDEHS